MKLMVITVQTSTTTQRFYSYKFTKAVHSSAQLLSIVLDTIFKSCTHVLMQSPSQTKDYGHWSVGVRLVHTRNRVLTMYQ